MLITKMNVASVPDVFYDPLPPRGRGKGSRGVKNRFSGLTGFSLVGLMFLCFGFGLVILFFLFSVFTLRIS